MPKIITSDELQRWIKVGRSFILLDILPTDSFNKMHLPYSVNVSAKERGFEQKIDELVNDKYSTIVIYGDNGMQDELYIAGIKLSHAGYEDVYEFKGGMKEWGDLGFPLERTSLISSSRSTCVN